MLSIQELTRIYPNIKPVDQPTQSPDFFEFSFQQAWWQIPVKQLSATELELLKTFIQTENSEQLSEKQPWWAFLTGQRLSPPKKIPTVRIIQFKFKVLDQQLSYSDWLAAFSSLFDQVVACFFIDDYTGILIQSQKTTGGNETLDLDGIIQTIDNDFYTQTMLYIGEFWSVADHLVTNFQTEQAFFNQSTQPGVNRFEDAALNYYLMPIVRQASYIQSLKQQTKLDFETKQMIQVLYQHQGNLSATAKALFIHRNTLQYRLEKFYETTGLALKKPEALLWAYLIWVHQ